MNVKKENCYSNSKTKSVKIIFIRTDLIGDFVLWLSTAVQFRKFYTNSTITLLCNQQYVDLANSLNIFDKVIGLDIKKLRSFDSKYWLKIISALRKNTYDLAISSMVTRNIIVDTLISFTHAKQKIGINAHYNRPMFMKRFFDCYYDILIELSNKPLTELEFNHIFLEKLTNESVKFELVNLFDIFKLPIPKINGLPTKYITINLASSVSQKNWQLKKFIAVTEKLSLDYSIVILGAENERSLATRLINTINPKNPIIDMAGKTTLLESISILNKSLLFIGNDSALAHLATLLRVKSIIILGGGQFGRFFPYPPELIQSGLQHILYDKMDCYNCNWKCKYPLVNGSWKCIAEISIEQVLDKITKILGLSH
ncbi:glycosyltransferase family 9 protein [Aquella oligotrophica]|uniref:Glycosyltransferase family 9 protein n=1 Tax=Aquella oligotrophica TaxID=2067065 RepID=A0A2I7N9B4_9NEIS|nr:glycosyltransferase family 9 protein [Aquella oligotrophica]AUR53032.1 hypothetical protein CUN60_12260 [Aquella oligotrophica]